QRMQRKQRKPWPRRCFLCFLCYLLFKIFLKSPMAPSDWILSGANQRAAGEQEEADKAEEAEKTVAASLLPLLPLLSPVQDFFEVTDGAIRLDPVRSEPASGGVEQEETEEAEENVARLLCYLLFKLLSPARRLES